MGATDFPWRRPFPPPHPEDPHRDPDPDPEQPMPDVADAGTFPMRPLAERQPPTRQTQTMPRTPTMPPATAATYPEPPEIPDEDLLAPFVAKLYRMTHGAAVEGTEVVWRTETRFTVTNPARFAARVVPRFFEHAKFKSFARQLNNYGFSKVAGPADASAACTFEHTAGAFVRNRPELLHKIKRKKQRTRRGKRVVRHPTPTQPHGDTRGRTPVPATLRTERLRLAQMQAEVTTLKRKRDEDVATIALARAVQATMHARIDHLHTTADAMRQELDAARAEHTELAAALTQIVAAMPPAFDPPTHPAPTPLADRLHADTLALVFGHTHVDPDMLPFPPVVANPLGLDAGPPRKRARPLPSPPPNDFWAHVGAARY